MARISLIPHTREFFVLYSRAARNAVEIARLLVQLLEEFPRDGGLLRDIKELEQLHEQASDLDSVARRPAVEHKELTLLRNKRDPQKREFFVLYSRAARNAVEIARLLVQLLELFDVTQQTSVARELLEQLHEQASDLD